MMEEGDRPVLILCGGGNNGGDGLAVARHLHNRGLNIRILLTSDPEKYSGDAKINWEICRAMNLSAKAATLEAIGDFRPKLIVDAIFGTGLTQAPARAVSANLSRRLIKLVCRSWRLISRAAWIAIWGGRLGLRA